MAAQPGWPFFRPWRVQRGDGVVPNHGEPGPEPARAVISPSAGKASLPSTRDRQVHDRASYTAVVRRHPSRTADVLGQDGGREWPADTQKAERPSPFPGGGHLDKAIARILWSDALDDHVTGPNQCV